MKFNFSQILTKTTHSGITLNVISSDTSFWVHHWGHYQNKVCINKCLIASLVLNRTSYLSQTLCTMSMERKNTVHQYAIDAIMIIQHSLRSHKIFLDRIRSTDTSPDLVRSHKIFWSVLTWHWHFILYILNVTFDSWVQYSEFWA